MILNDCYIGYLNLDHRLDRREHMERELARVGLSAERTRGMLPQEIDDGTNPKYQVMWNRTKGALPCHYGQVAIMKKALQAGKHAFVMEDDVVFCSDLQQRIADAESFLKDKDWQILWLGGTYHVSTGNSPTWWHKPGHGPDLPQCDCAFGVDATATDDKRFVQTYGAFSTHCYIVNRSFIESLLKFLEANIHLSMGIDWLMILLQPKIKAYAPVPGMAKQLDNKSDIGSGMTIFSGFRMLGEHWFQDRAEDFNYDNFIV